jgi:hypothetical protein
MSLAITAAPFDSDNQNQDNTNFNYNYNDTPVNKKRQTMNSSHNKTQKRMSLLNSEINSEKVNTVLQSIHNSTDNELGDFNPKKNQASLSSLEKYNPTNPLNPLEPPISVKTQQSNEPNNTNTNFYVKEGMTNQNLIPKPVDNDEMDLQELQSAFLNDAQVRDYYKKLIPTYQNRNSPSYDNKAYYTQRSIEPTNNTNNANVSNDILLNKINYMINLLEDQQDERTNNVTEEVVLYSFLGIFIIFIADSFARVGKYTR